MLDGRAYAREITKEINMGNIYSQRKGKNIIDFDFNDKSLNYHIKDESNEITIEINYSSITKNQSTLFESNKVMKNYSIYLLILSIAVFILKAINLTGIPHSIFLIGSILTYLIYKFSKVTFTRLAYTNGFIYIINDEKHDVIMNEIDTNRKRVLKEMYGIYNPANEIEDEILKYKTLVEYGVYSEEEYQEIIKEINKTRNIQFSEVDKLKDKNVE